MQKSNKRPQYLVKGQHFPLPRMESRNAAAGGRRRHCGISAAVGESEEQRKPERFFGHRKAEKPQSRDPARPQAGEAFLPCQNR